MAFSPRQALALAKAEVARRSGQTSRLTNDVYSPRTQSKTARLGASSSSDYAVDSDYYGYDEPAYGHESLRPRSPRFSDHRFESAYPDERERLPPPEYDEDDIQVVSKALVSSTASASDVDLASLPEIYRSGVLMQALARANASAARDASHVTNTGRRKREANRAAAKALFRDDDAYEEDEEIEGRHYEGYAGHDDEAEHGGSGGASPRRRKKGSKGAKKSRKTENMQDAGAPVLAESLAALCSQLIDALATTANANATAAAAAASPQATSPAKNGAPSSSLALVPAFADQQNESSESSNKALQTLGELDDRVRRLAGKTEEVHDALTGIEEGLGKSVVSRVEERVSHALSGVIVPLTLERAELAGTLESMRMETQSALSASASALGSRLTILENTALEARQAALHTSLIAEASITRLQSIGGIVSGDVTEALSPRLLSLERSLALFKKESLEALERSQGDSIAALSEDLRGCFAQLQGTMHGMREDSRALARDVNALKSGALAEATAERLLPAIQAALTVALDRSASTIKDLVDSRLALATANLHSSLGSVSSAVNTQAGVTLRAQETASSLRSTVSQALEELQSLRATVLEVAGDVAEIAAVTGAAQQEGSFSGGKDPLSLSSSAGPHNLSQVLAIAEAKHKRRQEAAAAGASDRAENVAATTSAIATLQATLHGELSSVAHRLESEIRTLSSSLASQQTDLDILSKTTSSTIARIPDDVGKKLEQHAALLDEVLQGQAQRLGAQVQATVKTAAANSTSEDAAVASAIEQRLAEMEARLQRSVAAKLEPMAAEISLVASKAVTGSLSSDEKAQESAKISSLLEEVAALKELILSQSPKKRQSDALASASGPDDTLGSGGHSFFWSSSRKSLGDSSDRGGDASSLAGGNNGGLEGVQEVDDEEDCDDDEEDEERRKVLGEEDAGGNESSKPAGAKTVVIMPSRTMSSPGGRHYSVTASDSLASARAAVMDPRRSAAPFASNVGHAGGAGGPLHGPGAPTRARSPAGAAVAATSGVIKYVPPPPSSLSSPAGRPSAPFVPPPPPPPEGSGQDDGGASQWQEQQQQQQQDDELNVLRRQLEEMKQQKEAAEAAAYRAREEAAAALALSGANSPRQSLGTLSARPGAPPLPSTPPPVDASRPSLSPSTSARMGLGSTAAPPLMAVSSGFSTSARGSALATPPPPLPSGPRPSSANFTQLASPPTDQSSVLPPQHRPSSVTPPLLTASGSSSPLGASSKSLPRVSVAGGVLPRLPSFKPPPPAPGTGSGRTSPSTLGSARPSVASAPSGSLTAQPSQGQLQQQQQAPLPSAPSPPPPSAAAATATAAAPALPSPPPRPAPPSMPPPAAATTPPTATFPIPATAANTPLSVTPPPAPPKPASTSAAGVAAPPMPPPGRSTSQEAAQAQAQAAPPPPLVAPAPANPSPSLASLAVQNAHAQSQGLPLAGAGAPPTSSSAAASVLTVSSSPGAGLLPAKPPGSPHGGSTGTADSPLDFDPPPPPPSGAVASFLMTLLKGLPLNVSLLYVPGEGPDGSEPVDGGRPFLGEASSQVTVSLDVSDRANPKLQWTPPPSIGSEITAFSIPSVELVSQGATSEFLSLLSSMQEVEIPVAENCITVLSSGVTSTKAKAAGGNCFATVLLECQDDQEAAFVASCLWDLVKNPHKVGKALDLFQKKGLWTPEGGVVGD